MSPPRLLVVGTDTGVGKTVVSALLLHHLAAAWPLAYWKPVATGAREDSDPATIRGLCTDLLAAERLTVLPEVYAFDEPLSPHLAARLAGAAIDPAAILAACRDHFRHHPDHALVAEGAGGLLVPLTEEGFLLIDLVAGLGLPCLLVARSTIGTINHTLLSLEALGRRRAPVLGVVMVGPPNRENRRAIERFGATPVIAEVPRVGSLDAAACRELAARIPANFLVHLS